MIVNEIFSSLNGEINKWDIGRPATFVRLAGCNLKCSWCDTEYAQDLSSGSEMYYRDVVRKVEKLGQRAVTITGGEPFLQMHELILLCRKLRHVGHLTSIETNGTIEPPDYFRRKHALSIVMDWKLPSSGMSSKMNPKAFQLLGRNDYVKFVIKDADDLEEAKRLRPKLISDGCKATFIYSPMWKDGRFDKEIGALIANYLISLKEFGSLLSIQLHKLLDMK
jgi:7-carboxy-7-deazaguanine synthase